MLQSDEILVLVKHACTHAEPSTDETSTPKSIRIDARDLIAVCENLHRGENTYFDMLSCLTAIDNGTDMKTIEIIYNLYSIPFDKHLGLKITLSRENPVVDSVAGIWKTADWHEREAFDMFGITFNGHPDLRRILMPADWEGFPLRKDYKQQAYYRDIKLDY